MTYTSLESHDILREGFDRSPMFGRIKSLGPRYCPSIEDKINRFVDKERSPVYLWSPKVGILVRLCKWIFNFLDIFN
jgi:tRNA U34 5-carboxymethylaminomethyl modifying enzyme MnmG/GidA